MTKVATLNEIKEFCLALCLVTKDPFAHCKFNHRASYTALLVQVEWQANGQTHAFEYAVSDAELTGAMEVDVFNRLLFKVTDYVRAYEAARPRPAQTDFKTR